MVTESEVERRAELQAIRDVMYNRAMCGTLIDMVCEMRIQIHNIKLFKKAMPELGETMDECEKSVEGMYDTVCRHICELEHEIVKRYDVLTEGWSDEDEKIGKTRCEELMRIRDVAYMEGQFMYMRAWRISDAEGMLRDMPYAHPNYLSEEEREFMRDTCKRLKVIADGTMEKGTKTWEEIDRSLYRISLDDPKKEETCQAEH